MSAPAATLAVIAKAPVAGRVKTRLCPPCTPQEAAQLAEAALRDTLATVLATPAGRHVVLLDGERGPWLPAGFTVLPQRGGGLDERLANGFADIGRPALIIGMDTPQVTSALLTAGLAALERSPAVLGATDDGGYWTIGLREPRADALVGVPMSRADTCAAQRLRLAQLGLDVAELPGLVDVDDAGSARVVAAGMDPASAFAQAAAAAGLARRAA
jgi:rSAM/selenodomain-associated transferase 1